MISTSRCPHVSWCQLEVSWTLSVSSERAFAPNFGVLNSWESSERAVRGEERRGEERRGEERRGSWSKE
eukprot:759151-Hanusia_phi.AAC.1